MSSFTPHAASALADAIEAQADTPVGLPNPLPLPAGQGGAFIAEMAEAAAEMLAEFATATVRLRKREDLPTGDVLNPSVGVERFYPRHAYVGGFPVDRIDGQRIQAADLRVVFSGHRLAVRPELRDAIEIDGALHAIVSVKATPAAGPAALYVIQARAG